MRVCFTGKSDWGVYQRRLLRGDCSLRAQPSWTWWEHTSVKQSPWSRLSHNHRGFFLLGYLAALDHLLPNTNFVWFPTIRPHSSQTHWEEHWQEHRWQINCLEDDGPIKRYSIKSCNIEMCLFLMPSNVPTCVGISQKINIFHQFAAFGSQWRVHVVVIICVFVTTTLHMCL